MDQNSNPQDTNNNVFAQNEGQPFARRTVSWAFNLGLVILVMGLFAGWYFTASDEPDTTQADPQMPGNQYEESSVKGGVYDFFYGIFSGFGDESAPLENQAVSDVTTMPLTDAQRASQTGDDANGNVAVQDAALVPPANERIAPSYFNAKVLDYEGKVAGDIKAMIRNEDGERIVYFELDQSLTPADKPRDYHIAYDDVEIAEEEGARFIRLNKEQTEALAQTLYNNDDEKAQTNTQTPERP